MSDGYKLQLNIKGDGGYDAPLININGNDPEEFQRNVAFVVDNADDIMGAVTTLQAAYLLKKPSDNPPPQKTGGWSGNGSQQSQQQTQQVQQAPQNSGPAPTCRHGEMKLVPGGISKRTQKAYKAFWSCQGPRNEQCDTVDA
jgi:hypothetical protein